MPRRPLAAGALGLIMVLALSLITAVAWAANPVKGAIPATSLDKFSLASALAGSVERVASGHPFMVKHAQMGPLFINPSIDSALQDKAENILAQTGSRRTALVVVEAETGKVLVMAGRRGKRIDPRVALEGGSPAASLFKIITAAAALEETRIEPGSKVAFVGRPHTLYRFQVREKLKRKPQLITLEEGFADSNNPVFARLGMHRIGGDLLLWYGRALGFDRQLPFELPLATSILRPPRDDFEVGSLACGFNRYTTMSPLHAALLVSVFLNGGRFMQPYAVERVTGAGGETLYLGSPVGSQRLVSEATCKDMQQLMSATVTEGTARKDFRRLGRDKILKEIEIGGKTGTLRGLDRTELFQWFAGYGRDPETGRTLAICTLAVHGKLRAANPKKIARKMLREAFNPTHLVVTKRSKKTL